MVFGVAGIHAEQICCKDGGFVTACACANFNDDISVITRVFGNEQTFDLFFEDFDLWGEIIHIRFGEGDQLRIIFVDDDCFGFAPGFSWPDGIRAPLR